MKKTVLVLGFLFSANAIAETVNSFRCTTDKVVEDNAKTIVEFQIQGLGTAEATYFTEDPDSWEPVKMTPGMSSLMLNENWSVEQKADRLVLRSDGDGCQYTDFVLFKNTGYKKGWARVRDGGCGANAFYTTVTCQLK